MHDECVLNNYFFAAGTGDGTGPKYGAMDSARRHAPSQMARPIVKVDRCFVFPLRLDSQLPLAFGIEYRVSEYPTISPLILLSCRL